MAGPADFFTNNTVVSTLRKQLIITSDTTFKKADYPWLTRVLVQCVGGGGFGGGAAGTGAGESAAAGGGGGGSYAATLLDVADLAASEEITVGSTTGSSSNRETSFGSHVVAEGGWPADTTLATTEPSTSDGGEGGGRFSTGALIIAGSPGSPGIVVKPDHAYAGGAIGGNGGASGLGSGGGFGYHSGNADAYGYGGGGAGAWNKTHSDAEAGARGAPGVVILDLYG